MKVRQLHTRAEQTWLLVFEPGDEVVSLLERFASDQALNDACFSAIGTLSSAVVERGGAGLRPTRLEMSGPVEVLSLEGALVRTPPGSLVRASVLLSTLGGQALAGRLIEGRVAHSLELILEETAVREAGGLTPGAGAPTGG